jgi:hypothetical protein
MAPESESCIRESVSFLRSANAALTFACRYGFDGLRKRVIAQRHDPGSADAYIDVSAYPYIGGFTRIRTTIAFLEVPSHRGQVREGGTRRATNPGLSPDRVGI